MSNRFEHVEGKATRTSAGTTAVLAAPGAGKKLMITDLICTIHTIAGTGKVIIDDGTTEWFGWDAITAGSGQPAPIHVPDGIEWTENKPLNLTTVGAIEAFCYARAEKRG